MGGMGGVTPPLNVCKLKESWSCSGNIIKIRKFYKMSTSNSFILLVVVGRSQFSFL